MGRCLVLALCAGVAGCDAAQAGDIEPLPPLTRPSPERRAGLPEIKGTWRFAGFEIPPGDTLAARADSTALPPPGDFVVGLQRLDSVAGFYARAGGRFPFVGEVRRDSVVAVVVSAPDGTSQFAAGRVVNDTLWLELTSFTSAQVWPRGTRAALVRTPVRQTFRRLVGGQAIPVPVDSAALDSMRMADSVAARQGGVPGAAPPPAAPVPGQPPASGAAPAAPRPQPPAPPLRQPPAPTTPVTPPVQRPPVQRPPVQRPPVQPAPSPEPPEPAPPPRRDTLRIPDPDPPAPVFPPPVPVRPAPRETIRFPTPPR